MLTYDTLDDLFDRYSAFLVDQFGVLIGGDGPYPGASGALSHLARLGKPVIILSNSGKRAGPNCERLVRNGFDRAAFQTVLSSGEVAHRHMAQAIGTTIPQGAKVLVLIREGDTPPLDHLDVVRTDQPDDADLLLIVSRDPARALGSYEAVLQRLAERGVPGLCVNPDLRMLTPDGLIASAGRLGQMFEGFGGALDWFGKPHPLIYACARDMLQDIPPEAVLCIGDSLQHDIAGGGGAGFKTALVRTGVDADVPDSEMAQMIARARHRPDHLISAFRRGGRERGRVRQRVPRLHPTSRNALIW